MEEIILSPQGGFYDGRFSVMNEVSSFVAGLWMDPWLGTIVAQTSD
jgi:hypothetical protein